MGISANMDCDNEKEEASSLVGFIMAMPLFLHHHDLGYSLKEVQDDSSSATPNFAMIDFVCVSQDHRGKRLCPFLYAEITRRCHARGLYRLICTSGDPLRTPYTSSDF